MKLNGFNYIQPMRFPDEAVGINQNEGSKGWGQTVRSCKLRRSWNRERSNGGDAAPNDRLTEGRKEYDRRIQATAVLSGDESSGET